MNDPDAGAVTVRRLLPAPPHIVYDQWLDPVALGDWMCPRPARCLAIESDPRVGGRVRFEIEERGATFSVSGHYLVLDRPRQLSFTWSCSTWQDPGVRSVVSVQLEEHATDQTLMTITHTLLPPDLADQHASGWTAIANQLADVLTALGRPRPARP